MRFSLRNPQRGRPSGRNRCRLAVEFLEERLTPDVTLPPGFVNVTIVNTGLTSPAALEVLPDGRVLVALQNGTIRVVQNDAMLPQPLIILPNVDSNAERGLLGVTYDPNFLTNQYIYVYYTANAVADPMRPYSHNRLSRLTVTGSTAGDEQILWRLPSIGTAIWHMGGAIHFGPDGMIYVSVGDHQNTSTPQVLTSQFGKILRLNVSSVPATIPTNNPFYNTAAGDNRSIWALGLRNPYTSAWQMSTGRFYLNDVGNSAWEEINAGAAARNFGWPTTEGYFNQQQYPNFTNPVFAYPHSGPGTSAGCAITGGDFYNPLEAVFPAQYVGKYFFQDFCRGWLRTFDPNTNTATDFGTGLSFPVDLRTSRDGALYYITRGQATGGQPPLGGIGKIIYPANQRPIITAHPQNQLAAVGEPVTFTVGVSSPTPVTYQWQRNSVNIPGATAASYTIPSTTLGDHGARFRVIVTNTAGSTASNEALLEVVNSQRPTAAVISPWTGHTYRGGDVVKFAGRGFDPEDGDLPAKAFTWQIDFHHDDHVHPFLPPTSGFTHSSFVVPTDAHPEGVLYFRIYLTVRDSAGLVHTSFRDIYPQRALVTLDANHAGLRVNVNGQPQALPYVVDAVVNTDLPLETVPVQIVGPTTYVFRSWSQGGGATQTYRVPAADVTLLATFDAVVPIYVSDLPFVGTPINGWGPVERDMSNGEQGAGDGRPITLNTVVYPKGLGCHAYSEITFNLAGQYAWFLSDVGVDDEVGNNGSVVFQILADGILLYDSGLMTGASATRTGLVSVAGRNQLKLIVRDGGDGIGFDHADWAGARLIQAGRASGSGGALVAAFHVSGGDALHAGPPVGGRAADGVNAVTTPFDGSQTEPGLVTVAWTSERDDVALPADRDWFFAELDGALAALLRGLDDEEWRAWS